jgi:hypothetical protein
MNLTLEQWKSRVAAKHPKAKFKKGGGYGSSTDWVALVGNDMQNPLAVFSPENEFWSIEGAGEGQAKAKDALPAKIVRRAKMHRALDAVLDRCGALNGRA